MFRTIPTEKLISPRPLVRQAKRGKRGYPLTAKNTEDVVLLFLEGLSGSYSPSSGWGYYTRSVGSDGTALNCNSSIAAYFNPIGGLVILSSPISWDIQRQCRRFNIPYVFIRCEPSNCNHAVLAEKVRFTELKLMDGHANVWSLISETAEAVTGSALSRIQEYL